MTLPAGMEQRKRERISPALAESDRSRLSFELDGNYFKWFVTEAFRQVGEGVHVLHRPGACLDVLCPPVRVREFSMDVRQEDGSGLRVAVHHHSLFHSFRYLLRDMSRFHRPADSKMS